MAACAPNRYQRAPSSANASPSERKTSASSDTNACALQTRLESDMVGEVARPSVGQRPFGVKSMPTLDEPPNGSSSAGRAFAFEALRDEPEFQIRHGAPRTLCKASQVV